MILTESLLLNMVSSYKFYSVELYYKYTDIQIIMMVIYLACQLPSKLKYNVFVAPTDTKILLILRIQ